MVVALLMQLVMLHRGNYHKVLQFCLTTTVAALGSFFMKKSFLLFKMYYIELHRFVNYILCYIFLTHNI